MTTGVQDRVAEATAVAEEAFSQIRTVQSFVQEPAERARYGERMAASVRTALQRAQVRGVFFGMLTFSTFAGIVFVLWQGGLLVLDGKLTAGALVAFLLYTITIAASIGALASSLQHLPGGGGRRGAGVRDPGDGARPSPTRRRRRRCRRRSRGGWRSRACASATSRGRRSRGRWTT